MANEEHLNILKQGIQAWNKWRAENAEIVPDLSKADLNGVDLGDPELVGTTLDGGYVFHRLMMKGILTGINLEGANLQNTNFIGAKLTGAYFDGANLSLAKMTRADLTGANLHDTILFGTNLVGANLARADFSRAYLMSAHLANADLTGAHLTGTILNGVGFNNAVVSNADVGFTAFVDCDLGLTQGLESVNHIAPSSVGIDTLYLSAGKIPESFLRGCGVPDEFITYARSLVGSAIEFYSTFISYSSKNQDFAERLYADLQSKGVRCWFAPEDIKIGDKFRQRIDEAIRLHDKLLVILSEDSISSSWVEEEVESGLERERRENRPVLFPVRIDNAVMESGQAWAASLRRMRHIGDFSRWKDHDSYSRAFDSLLRDLKAKGKAL